MKGVWDWLCGVGGALVKAWGDFVTWIGEAWRGFETSVGEAWKTICEAASGTWNSLMEATGPLRKAWGDFAKDIGEKWEAFKSDVGVAWEGIYKAVSDVWDSLLGALGLRKVWTDFTTWLGGEWEMFKSWFGGGWQKLCNDIQSWIGGVIGKIREMINALWELVAARYAAGYTPLEERMYRFQRGFTGVVTGPMTFIAGEAGPEFVNVQPLTRMRGVGAGSVVVIQNISGPLVEVRGHADRQLAEEVGQFIVSELKGYTHLKFVTK